MEEPAKPINPHETGGKPGEPGNKAGRKFEPGNKLGKLGGRPKGLARRAREEVGDDGDRLVSLMAQHARGWRFMVNPAIDATEEMAADPANWQEVTVSDQQAAIRWLADRGFGKAQEFVPIEEDTLQLGADWKALAEAVERDMDELEAQRRKRAEAAAAGG